MSRSLIDLWTDEVGLDHIRTALLDSHFLVETNIKSAGTTVTTHIGCAVRSSLDIELHCETSIWSTIEEKMYRRV